MRLVLPRGGDRLRLVGDLMESMMTTTIVGRFEAHDKPTASPPLLEY